jgi:perosamine synthetase
MIPVLCPKPTGTEIEHLKEVIDSGWWGMGPKVQELEEKWAKYTGARYAVAVNSCTSALDIACRIVKLKSPVKVSAFTFVSSALSPLNAGYKIKFVDIDKDSFCTKKSDIQVMYAGNQFGEGKIYDMAHSGGAKHKGLISCWSFHAVKNLPAGDGGMLTMNSKKLYERAKAMSWCGIDKSTWQRSGKKYSWDYEITEQGLKAHMNDITATIALEQLKCLHKGNQYRKYLAETYNRYLPKWIKRPYRSATWHLYTIRVPHRDELFDHLGSLGYGCGVHYKPLYKYKIFGRQNTLPVTEKVFKEIITLPIHLNLSESEARNICESIRAFYYERYGFQD